MSSKALRIGIACYPTIGGSGILATELGIALAERGHEVHFLAYSELPRLSENTRVKTHRIEVSAYPLFKYPPYDLALASKMRELLCDGLDILHVHYAIPHALCAYLAKQMAPNSTTKVITTLHGTDITVVGSDESYHEVTRFGLQHSDRVIAVSQYLAEETHRLFDIRRDIDVVHNFVDTDRFVPLPKAPGSPLTVVHMSNFRAVKRPQDVIRAFALINQHVDAVLKLIGIGPDLEHCLKLACDLGIADHVHRLGEVSDVENVLATADLLLQPSGSEAFGLAALEGLSCGVPVVGYRIAGLPEVVTDGETGFLVPYKDVEALASRSVEILASGELRRSMGQAGRKRAVDRFNVARCVAAHEQLYRDALREPADRSPA